MGQKGFFAAFSWPRISSHSCPCAGPWTSLFSVSRALQPSCAQAWGLRSDDRDYIQDRWKPSIQLNQKQAIAIRELEAAAHLPLQHDQLMSECRVLCLKSALRLERRGEQGQEETEQRDHRRSR